MKLGKLALALGLKEDASLEDVCEAAAKRLEDGGKATQTLSSLSTQLGEHGLKLDQEKLVKLAAKGPPADETPREKEMRERMDKQELANAKLRLSSVGKEVESLILAGKVPPAVKQDLLDLMSIGDKAQALALSKDGTQLVQTGIDAVDKLRTILNALPSIKGSQLSQHGATGDVDEVERKRQKDKAKEVASRVGGTKK